MYRESKKKNKDTKDKTDKTKDRKKYKDSDDVPTELNFAFLEVSSYCCGKKGHRSPQCNKKDEIPKNEWAINKTAEAILIQATPQKNSTNGRTQVKPAPGPPLTPSSSMLPFRWMAMNIQMKILNNEMKNWVLLDTGSTVHVFCNEVLVKNIQSTQEQLHITTNAGTFK
jgi:hypothetical protein